MRVEDVMTKDVSVCSPGTNAAAAAEIMWNRDCGILPVLEDSGQLVGMVTDRDLFIALGTQNRNPSDLQVGEIMHREPSACSPEDDVRNALKTMAKQRLRRLPVIDKSREIKGILSIDDVILQAKAETDGVFKDDVIRTLKAICQNEPRKSPRQELPQAKLATA
ncbi:MAG: CBS domain-containing protein [Acidobacteriia bacterium]|nr:CBS domain-containing protein [Terriglobia bacterium]